MSGPWEEFSSSGQSGVEDGPWSEFSGGDASKKKSKGILSDIGNSVIGGAKSAGRAIAGTVDAYTNDESGLVQKAKAQEAAEQEKPEALRSFNQAVEARVRPLGEDPGLIDSIKAVGGSVADQPKGAGLAVMEQIPNAAPALAGGFGGMKLGSALGTAIAPGPGTVIGSVLGGLAGMFLGNAAIETGYKGIDAAQDGKVSADEMGDVRREGAVKSGVITGVDALTLGLSKAVTNVPARAVETATRRALTKAGVDVADEAAVLAARQSPEISAAVRSAQEAAFASANSLGKRAAAGGAALGLETVGEGLGEYLGELAATGKANIADAVLESLMSLGQSGAEVAWGAARNKKEEKTGVWDVATESGAENSDNPLLALPSPTYTGTPGDQMLNGDVERQAAIDAAQSNADAIYASREQFERDRANGFRDNPQVTEKAASIKERIDSLIGIDTDTMSDKERKQYERDLTKAFLEPVGVTQDANGLEVPFTMADYLNAQVKAEDEVRARPLRQGATDAAGARLQQVADEEMAVQPDIAAPSIPVVGPISAAANLAVKSGAATNPVGILSGLSQGVAPNAAQPEQVAQKAPQANASQVGAEPSAAPQGILANVPAVAAPISVPAQPVAKSVPAVTSDQAVVASSPMADPAPAARDLTGRTNSQLDHLIANGSTREIRAAAKAELAKRKSQEIPNGDVVTNSPQSVPALSVGSAPGSADPISVRNGVVYIGKYPAQNFDTGEDVAVQDGATPQQIVSALKESGAISPKQKVFGLKAPDTESGDGTAKAKKEVSRNKVDPLSDSMFVAIAKLGAVDTDALTSNGIDINDITVETKARVSKKTGALGKKRRMPISFGFAMPLHKKGGASIDSMRESLQQYGYLGEGSTERDFLDLFGQELRGNPVYTASAMEQMVAQDQDAFDKMMQEEQDRIDAELAAQEIAESESGYFDLDEAEQSFADDAVEFAFGDNGKQDDNAIRAGMRSLGFTEDEINDELAKNSQTQREGEEVVSGQGEESVFGRDGNSAPDAQARERGGEEGFDLTGQTNAQAAEQFAQQQAGEETAPTKEQADRERDAVPFSLSGQSQAKPQGVQAGLFTADGRVSADAKPARGDVGASLTKDQRNSVLKTLVDVYRQKSAPREMKGVDGNGNERYGYVHSPELFEKSDITGAMVRYYVTLPDGRIAHPTELFADYTQADIDAAMQKEIGADRERERNDKSERERLLGLTAPTINEANRKFNHAQRFAQDRESIVPALLTNGELYLRSRPENADKAASLLGDGWRVEELSNPADDGKPANKAEDAGDQLDVAKIRAGYAHRSLGGLGDKVKMEQGWFDSAAKEFAEKVGKDAESDEQKALSDKLLADFKDEYKTRRYRVMDVGAGVVSSAVAGRNNFNSAQAGRRGSALDRAEQEFSDWQKGAIESGVRAIRAARSPEQIAAEQQAKADKAAKKKAELHALLSRLMDFKKGDEVRFGNYPVAKVSLDKAGYPSSVTVDATDLTDNKFDIARVLFGGDKDKLRAAVNEIRAIRPAAEESPADAGPLSLVEQHNADVAKLYDGELSVDELKAAFAMVRDNRAAIEAELSKFKKDELLRSGGAMFGYRHKSDTKPEIVKAAYAAMIDNFIMGESISYALGGGTDWVTTKVKAIQARVDAATPESLAAYADKIKANRAEREQRREETAKAMADPQTLDDYTKLLRTKVDSGMTPDQARMSLTPEQRVKLDDLLAEDNRSRRGQRVDAAKTDVRVAETTTTGDIIETKHTKTGEDLFVVKAADRVERDVFKEWSANAKRLGGWYSSFRGNGAVPGFQFKSRDEATAFLKYIGGDVGAAKEAIAGRRDAFEDDRSQSAVERLNEMADRLEDRADESLSYERKTNTARRAQFAASAEAAANSDKALANTMRNIAKSISEGTAKFLDKVRQKVQVEMLQSKISRAKYDELTAKYPSYADRERNRGEQATAETVDYAKWPTYTAYRSDLARFGRELVQIDGAKKLGQSLLKVADDVTDAYQKFAKENLHKVSVFSMKRDGDEKSHPAIFPTADKAEAAIARSGYKGKATTVSFKRGEHMVIMGPEMAREAGLWEGDPDKRITLKAEFAEELVAKHKALRGKTSIPTSFVSASEERARWKAVGIESAPEMRAALREFIRLRETAKAPDKIKEMERSMIGRKNDGLDFFPTPTGTAQAMIDAAEAKEGMSVLEPSAGMGHIAEQIRESGIDPDVIEFNGDRRELLEMKGFNVVGSDFMEATGQYDRIIMNPPFSNRRDAEHVQHAYSLLKPGGRIVAIMGEGVFFGQDKKAQAFREWLNEVGGTSEKLEEGTFLDPSLPVNTATNARMVVIDKPAGESAPIGSDKRSVSPKMSGDSGLGNATIAPSKSLPFIADILAKEGAKQVTVKGGNADVLNRVAKLFGKKIVFFRTVDAGRSENGNVGAQAGRTEPDAAADGKGNRLPESDYITNGFVNPGRPDIVFLNVDSSNHLLYIVGHELGHSLKVDDPALWSEMGKQLQPLIRRWSEYKANQPQALDEAGMAEELFGDIIGQNFLNEAFWSDMAQENQSLFAKIGRAAIRLINKAMSLIAGQDVSIYVSDMEQARAIVAKTMAKYAEGSAKGMYSNYAKQYDGEYVNKRMVAWHGSPHDHDKFDSSKIGTGEGAQAYGYGLYFAGKKDVAEWYRKNLSGSKDWGIIKQNQADKAIKEFVWPVIQKSETYGVRRFETIALEALQNQDTLEVHYAVLNERLRKARSEKEKAFAKRDIDLIDALGSEAYSSVNAALESLGWKGRLYQVELAPSEDEYLDWDKPLSEQSEKVKASLGNIVDLLNEERGTPKSKHPDLAFSGSGIYGWVSKAMGGDKAASDYLHSIGIRGIRYLDGSSRNAGEGNHNYVIFNDEDVSITAKYNVASKWKISPADKAIYGMAAEGKSSAEILKFIASASRSPFNRQVAKLLLKTGIAPKITVGNSKGWKFNAGEGKKYAAAYNQTTDTVALFRPAAAERNMLHELVHAATIRALGRKGLASAQMNALFNHVKKTGKLKGMYGMSDIDEFTAETFSNPMFQERLKAISAPAGDNKLATAWDWFIRVVRGILGLPANRDSALSRALEIGIGVMREDMAIRRVDSLPETAGIAERNDYVNRSIEQWAAGELKSGIIIDLGKPSGILKRFGVPDLPINMTQRVLIKAVREKHAVEVGDLKDFVINIQAPIAVFKSKRDGKIVVVTEARHADGNIVVALDLEVTRDSISINDVRSIYPKRDSSVSNWIADGLLIGADKHKGRDWLENSAGSNSQQPQVNAALDGAIIYDGRLIRKAAETAVIKYNQSAKPLGDTINIDGVERPTTNSNGKQIAQTEEGMLNFWRWAGESVLADEQGRPVVYYHGSKTPQDLTEFVPGGKDGSRLTGDAYGVGSYFTTSQNEASSPVYTGEEGAVFPVYVRGNLLNLGGELTAEQSAALTKLANDVMLPSDKARFALGRKTREFDDVQDARDFFDNQRANWQQFGDGMDRAKPEARADGGKYQVEYTDFDAQIEINTGEEADTLLRAIGFGNAMAAGFDGIVMNKAGGSKWAVMYRTDGNVKSATGNNGDFDGANPDIRYNVSGKRSASSVNDYQKRADQLDRAFTAMGLESRRESSRASASEYVAVQDPNNEDKTYKFRVSNHRLPSGYTQPDFDVIADGVDHDGVMWNASGTWIDAVDWISKKTGVAPKGIVKAMITKRDAEQLALETRIKEAELQRQKFVTDSANRRVNQWQEWLKDLPKDAMVRASKKGKLIAEVGGRVINGPDATGWMRLSNSAIAAGKSPSVTVADAIDFVLEGAPAPNSAATRLPGAPDNAGMLERSKTEPAQSKIGAGSVPNITDQNEGGNAIRYNVADEGWSVSEPSRMDDVIYSLQDKQIDMKRVVDAIKSAGRRIADSVNPYLQEELFHGRAAKGVSDFLDFELRPMLKQMKDSGIEMGDFEEYLWNRHAEERNAQIAKINPEMKDGGSGIKTEDARAYLSGLSADRKQAFESLAAMVDTINRNSQAILVSSGLEKQETIDAWNGAYKHYVPLQREDVDSGHVGTGKGFSIRGSSTKRAMGSGKAVVDIIANLTMQRERNIVRAEKNRVSNALLGLATQNPNPDFWTVDKAPKERVVQERAIYIVRDADGNKLDDFTNMRDAERFSDSHEGSEIEQVWGDRVNERVVPGFQSRDNVVLTRINGEDHYVIFNERDERAMRMAKSLKNLDVDNMGRVLSIVGRATRYLASVNTQYNPVFGVINLIRDVQGALINLTSTPLASEQKRVLGYTLDALRGIYSDIRAHRRGDRPSSNWAKLFEEFQKEGGQTGYRDQYANAEQRAEAIQSELKQFSEGKPRQLARGVFGWLSDYNETMENAVRLAAYKAAKEKGMSNQQAASLAKNITVNFNRKGQVATQVGALYAFFNASVQGTARLAQTMFEQHGGDEKTIRLSKVGKKILAGGIMLGSMQAMLLAAAGYDDDEPPEFIRERSLVLPIGDGKYLTLPMPLGFHVIPGIGRIATEFALSGFKDPSKRVIDMLGMISESFNPIGSAGLSIQTLTPSVVDPFAALAENRDFTGREIYRENFNANDPAPGHARAKDVATAWSRYISEAINFITGGTEFKPGAFSPSPDAIDYLIAQAGGGVAREANKVSQTIQSTITGDDLPLYKVPLVGRFVGDTEGQSGHSQKFYSTVREINQHEREIKGLRESGRIEEAREYMEENPLYRMSMLANRTETQVRKLRDIRRKASDEGDSAKVRAINEQITSLMTNFNERAAPLLE